MYVHLSFNNVTFVDGIPGTQSLNPQWYEQSISEKLSIILLMGLHTQKIRYRNLLYKQKVYVSVLSLLYTYQSGASLYQSKLVFIPTIVKMIMKVISSEIFCNRVLCHVKRKHSPFDLTTKMYYPVLILVLKTNEIQLSHHFGLNHWKANGDK